MWLDTLRVAKEHGNLDALLPPGVRNWRDCPHTIFEAVRLGHIFLSFEELPEDERPARRIWLDPAQLTAWFDDVKRRRESQSSGSRDWDRSIEDPVSNEAARGLIVG